MYPAGHSIQASSSPDTVGHTPFPREEQHLCFGGPYLEGKMSETPGVNVHFPLLQGDAHSPGILAQGAGKQEDTGGWKETNQSEGGSWGSCTRRRAIVQAGRHFSKYSLQVASLYNITHFTSTLSTWVATNFMRLLNG